MLINLRFGEYASFSPHCPHPQPTIQITERVAVGGGLRTGNSPSENRRESTDISVSKERVCVVCVFHLCVHSLRMENQRICSLKTVTVFPR